MTEPQVRDALEGLAESERRSAARALLARPLLVAERDQDSLLLVRRHREFLVKWFSVELGYRLVVESDFARLHRGPTHDSLPRRLTTRNGVAFDSRRYALFALALAALEQSEEQTTLARVAEAVVLLAADLPSFELDFDRGSDRRAFSQAMRAIVDLGVLDLKDGDEERFARGDEGGDALYRVRHRRLAQILSAPIPPSSVAAPGEMGLETYPDTTEGRSRRARHRLTRLLVEEPVLYFDRLETDDISYLNGQRARIFRQVQAVCGLEPELRSEGVATIDSEGGLSDVVFPAEGTVGHASLLLAEHLAERSRAGHPTNEMVALEFLSAQAERHAKHWRSDLAKGVGAREELTRLAIERLVDLGIIRRGKTDLEIRPAIARFRIQLESQEPD